MPIFFFYEETDFKIDNKGKTIKWLAESARREGKMVLDINYIFCSDRYLLVLNREFLNHNTLTDILTFDYSVGKSISGEIYISTERVQENSVKYKSLFSEELRRVMIHGVLHLIGYDDKKPRHAQGMREKEEAYLSLWESMFHVKQ